jgi:UDP-N-acetylmuramate dehydrogenase
MGLHSADGIGGGVNGQDIAALIPAFRGRLSIDAALSPLTWFRVGGPADVLASPTDEEDLAYLLGTIPEEIPITIIGVGSNLIVRDGGVRGVVIRLGGRAFSFITSESGGQLSAGAAALDAAVARASAEAELEGFAFLRGVPGSIGGALRMNAGAHNGEVKDILIEVSGYDRRGRSVRLDKSQMGYAYRHCSAPDDIVFTRAVFQGRPGVRAEIEVEMARITNARLVAQPIREKTGGSTFKNPPGQKAWQLIDAAGCRGLRIGDAQVSTLHCNFLLNVGAATAGDIEALGDEVHRRVREASGIALDWEIRRIGALLEAARR